jgi:hypothetical protein
LRSSWIGVSSLRGRNRGARKNETADGYET